MLHEDMRLLQTAMQQLQGVMEKIVLGLSRLEEQVSVQLGYLSSLAGNVTAPKCSADDAPKETPPSTRGQQTARALRRSLRLKKPYFSDLGK
ncbi:Hypothetical predicted protein [Pelobates cultripes]|uniref:Uncharacterized protein n=2 Tax=Pelobates cultripes TaxID=61616 RepID=A0AAD1W9C9_PELCU|nr:Hypothetical predicted protein [Pelobates cultripes]